MMDEHFWPSGVIPLTKAEYRSLKEKADAFDFLFGEEGIRVGNVMELWSWRNKIDAFKMWLGTTPSSYDQTGPLMRSDFDVWRAEALKILGDEE